MSATTNWKNTEKAAADILLEYKIPAKRHTRAGNFSESTWDVDIEPNPYIDPRVDAKFTKANPFRELNLLKGVKKKYCSEPKHIPIVFLHNYKDKFNGFLLEEKHLAGLLSYFMGYCSREEILKAWGIDGAQS